MLPFPQPRPKIVAMISGAYTPMNEYQIRPQTMVPNEAPAAFQQGLLVEATPIVAKCACITPIIFAFFSIDGHIDETSHLD